MQESAETMESKQSIANTSLMYRFVLLAKLPKVSISITDRNYCRCNNYELDLSNNAEIRAAGQAAEGKYIYCR